MTQFTSEFIAEARSSITETGVERYICIPVQIEMLDEIERLQSRIAELEQDLSNKEIEYTDLWDDALALQSRIAELEEFIGKLIEEGDALESQAYVAWRKYGMLDFPAAETWCALVKDWKEREG